MSRKKNKGPTTIRWPADFGDDFGDRLADVVARTNRKYTGTPRFRPRSLARYIADAVKKAIERDEKILDREESR